MPEQFEHRTNAKMRGRLRLQPEAARALLDQDEPFTIAEAGNALEGAWRGFVSSGVLLEADGDATPTKWAVSDAAAEYVRKVIGEGSPLPCNHSGVHNVRGEEGYTCRNEDCDVRFDRETAQEVLG